MQPNTIVVLPLFSPSFRFSPLRANLARKCYINLLDQGLNIHFVYGKTGSYKDMPYSGYVYTQALWYKENLINLALKDIDLAIENIIWLDADCYFEDDRWLDKVLYTLERYPVCQIWSIMHENDTTYPSKSAELENPGAMPGLGWAAKRWFLDDIGGLPDLNILGNGDTSFASCCMGTIERQLNFRVYSKGFNEYWMNNQQMIRKELGNSFRLPLVDNHIYTWDHPYKHRGGGNRNHLFQHFDYDPLRDIERFPNNTFALRQDTPNQIGLRQSIESYLLHREGL